MVRAAYFAMFTIPLAPSPHTPVINNACIYVDHLAWRLVGVALLVIPKGSPAPDSF
jgi:hypothetical protein